MTEGGGFVSCCTKDFFCVPCRITSFNCCCCFFLSNSASFIACTCCRRSSAIFSKSTLDFRASSLSFSLFFFVCCRSIAAGVFGFCVISPFSPFYPLSDVYSGGGGGVFFGRNIRPPPVFFNTDFSPVSDGGVNTFILPPPLPTFSTFTPVVISPTGGCALRSL